MLGTARCRPAHIRPARAPRLARHVARSPQPRVATSKHTLKQGGLRDRARAKRSRACRRARARSSERIDAARTARDTTRTSALRRRRLRPGPVGPPVRPQGRADAHLGAVPRAGVSRGADGVYSKAPRRRDRRLRARLKVRGLDDEEGARRRCGRLGPAAADDALPQDVARGRAESKNASCFIFRKGVGIPWRRVAAPPRLRRGYSVETSRDAAAAATRKLRGDESRRRRGLRRETAPSRRERRTAATGRRGGALAGKTRGQLGGASRKTRSFAAARSRKKPPPSNPPPGPNSSTRAGPTGRSAARTSTPARTPSARASSSRPPRGAAARFGDARTRRPSGHLARGS